MENLNENESTKNNDKNPFQKEIELILDDWDIQDSLSKLWRGRDHSELLKFLYQNKWNEDIDLDLYNFLQDKINDNNNTELLSFVKNDQIAVDLVNLMLEHSKWKLEQNDSLYVWDYINYISNYRFITTNKDEIIKSLNEKGDKKTLSEYHKMIIQDKNYEYRKDGTLLQYNKLMSSELWKKIWSKANEISKKLIDSYGNIDSDEKLMKVISLHNAMMIFLYWNNKKQFLDL